jgi:tripartite-type tricarboxylate transporter receptor subunit TctC
MPHPLPRRALAPLGAALLAAPAARAQRGWPERNVTLIVPVAPGGATDMIARTVAEGLAPRLGRPVVVDNRPGGAANIGVAALARATPDGHTIGMASLTTMALNPWVYRERLPFDPARDFAFLSNGAFTPNVLLVNPRRIPATSVPELVAWLRAHPGRANYGSGGVGTALHIAMELFLNAAGATATHVTYRGSAPLMTDLIAGQIEFTMDAAAVAQPHLQAGTIRALATTGARRPPFAADIPTLSELYPDVVLDAWHGFAAPAATPATIVARLSEEIQAVLREPAVAARMTAALMVPAPMTAEAFSAFAGAERARMGQVIERLNLRLE